MLWLFLLFLLHFCSSAEAKAFRVRPHHPHKEYVNLENEPVRTRMHQVVIEAGGTKEARVVAETHGYKLVGRVIPESNYYLIEREWRDLSNENDLKLHTETLGKMRGAVSGAFYEMKPQKRVTRGAAGDMRAKRPLEDLNTHRAEPWTEPSDPGYGNQWFHHGHMFQYDGTPGTQYRIFINSTAAHKRGFTGKGIHVAVPDDGFDYTHLDLFPNYESACSHNFVDPANADDCMPAYGDEHGSAASGVVAGARESTCGVGVAYGAKICGSRLLPTNRMPTDAEEAMALSWHSFQGYPRVDGYSCSWGTPDTGGLWGSVGPLAQKALHDAATKGRNGYGSFFVWAGGNGAESMDDGNFDAFCNNPNVVCVGAVTNLGYVAEYSEPCACLLVSAPSSGGTQGIYSDYSARSHHDGCTNNFGGTSAAAPQVAGVLAAVLQANPRLKVRDLMHILVQSSQQRIAHEVALAQENGRRAPLVAHSDKGREWMRNGAGLLHSDEFGFGQVDMGRAVDMATTWTPVPDGAEAHFTSNLSPNNANVSTHRTGFWAFSVSEAEAAAVRYTEHVELLLEISIPNDFLKNIDSITLTSPSGTESWLLRPNRHYDQSVHWSFSTVKNWGENPAGVWTLRMENGHAPVATLENAVLTIHGHA